MLLIIMFFVIIAFLLAAYIVLNVELDIDELICKIIFAGIFLMSIGAFMVVTYISVSYTSNIKMHEEIESSQTIVNLKDNRDTKGHFFIGTGYVGTEAYYYYYYQTKSGSYKANKIETDKCEIIYTNDTPHIDTIIQIPDEEQTKNWLTLSWLLSLQTSSNERYKIYVPEGSITDEFSIDME